MLLFKRLFPRGYVSVTEKWMFYLVSKSLRSSVTVTSKTYIFSTLYQDLESKVRINLSLLLKFKYIVPPAVIFHM